MIDLVGPVGRLDGAPAVQRIDQPAVLGLLAAGQAAFLGQYGVLRVGFVQVVDDFLFSRQVHVRHEVVDTLRPDFEALDQHGNLVSLSDVMGSGGAMVVFIRSADW